MSPRANTGSNKKDERGMGGGVNCCAQACTVKAAAVPSRPVIKMAQMTRGGPAEVMHVRQREQWQTSARPKPRPAETRSVQIRNVRWHCPTSTIWKAKQIAQPMVRTSPRLMLLKAESVPAPLGTVRKKSPAKAIDHADDRPGMDVLAPTEAQHERHQHHRHPGEESGFRGCGEFAGRRFEIRTRHTS